MFQWLYSLNFEIRSAIYNSKAWMKTGCCMSHNHLKENIPKMVNQFCLLHYTLLDQAFIPFSLDHWSYLWFSLTISSSEKDMKGEVYKCIAENSMIISPTCRKLLVSTNKVKGTRMGFLVPLSENQFFSF